MELLGDLEVVVLRPRATAQRAEIKPDNAAGAPQRAQFAVLDVQHRVLVTGLGQLAESGLQRGLGLLVQRVEVEPGLLQRSLPVVAAMVDVDDLELVLEHVDRRQDAVAVQAVGIERVGMKIRGRHDRHPVGEQRGQQAVQDHRVGDIGDVELVKADQPEPPGDALSQLVERIDRTLELLQLAVDLAHELVKVQPGLARQRH